MCVGSLLKFKKPSEMIHRCDFSSVAFSSHTQTHTRIHIKSIIVDRLAVVKQWWRFSNAFERWKAEATNKNAMLYMSTSQKKKHQNGSSNLAFTKWVNHRIALSFMRVKETKWHFWRLDAYLNVTFAWLQNFLWIAGKMKFSSTLLMFHTFFLVFSFTFTV